MNLENEHACLPKNSEYDHQKQSPFYTDEEIDKDIRYRIGIAEEFSDMSDGDQHSGNILLQTHCEYLMTRAQDKYCDLLEQLIPITREINHVQNRYNVIKLMKKLLQGHYQSESNFENDKENKNVEDNDVTNKASSSQNTSINKQSDNERQLDLNQAIIDIVDACVCHTDFDIKNLNYMAKLLKCRKIKKPMKKRRKIDT